MDIENNDMLYDLACKLVNSSELREKKNDKRKLEKECFVSTFLNVDENLLPTPTDTGFVLNQEITNSAISLVSYCVSLSLYPVVYQGENDGRLIRHVVPKRTATEQTSSHGSTKTFYPHVDNPDLRLRGESHTVSITPCPDTLTLFCLRNNEEVTTSLLRLDDVLSDLSDSDIACLYEPNFIVKRPDSFEEQSIRSPELPLLSKDKNGNICSRFDYHNVYSRDRKNIKALEKLRESTRDKSKWLSVTLKPGQALTFDNQRMLHTRNGFKPYHHGKERWLLRVFGLSSPPANDALLEGNCKHHLKTLY
ncbi:TauD/TfdA family dioxygenase [Oceanimonas smirnovii]|uniref:TauD/TfdA family dioxygenase n=1 Tax=Oceanimonas smirnovii TaxID=264574 RepID=UPI00039F3536|nr:TauD/TfdA family dioxygenase [Oceanimonas smirnovii]